MIKVLLIEDEATLALILHDSLKASGFDVSVCEDGNSGLQSFAQSAPDVAVIDVMLPVLNGFEVAKAIRKQNKSVPIIFLTALHSPDDIRKGFESGGDDYVKKPFNIEELIVRINAHVHKATGREEISEDVSTYHIGPYTFDTTSQSLSVGGQSIQLSFKEAMLLRMLCRHTNAIMPRDKALEEIWGANNLYNARNMDVYITKLRKHFAPETGIKIMNIKGYGYKLVVRV